MIRFGFSAQEGTNMMIARLKLTGLIILCAMVLLPHQAFSTTLELLIPLYKYPS
jgi:hypothetical protein